MALAATTPARAQPPTPSERVTFDEAVARAIARNPSSRIAAAGILRADALLTQVRAASRLQIAGLVTSTTLNTGVEFEGTTVTPRSMVTGAVDVRMPIYAPVAWARTAQAQDQRGIADLSAAETRRQTALAAADAYLAILARRRAVEASQRARDLASAYYDLASEFERQGRGSRLDQLRAQQVLSSDQGLLEVARFALYQAQEALGILLVADGPVDAADEPAFDVPTADNPAPAALVTSRADLRLFAAETAASERVFEDSRKDRYPYLEGVFQPATSYPGQFFAPRNSWQLIFRGSVPIWDSGERSGRRLERQAAVDVARATLDGAVHASASEVRTARQGVASSERALAVARAGADQAHQVLDILTISVKAGGATNIEVLDAERRARDADLGVALAEDANRRSRLDLLTALGLFPR
jgi:outer membrane protein TolC